MRTWSLGKSCIPILVAGLVLVSVALQPFPGRVSRSSGPSGATPVSTLLVEGTETGWIDLAYPVTEDVDADDIHINFTFIWEERPMGDDTQFWGAAYVGVPPDGTPTPPASMISLPSTEKRAWRDTAVEANVEVLGRDAEVTAPHAACANRCWGNRTVLRYDVSDVLAREYDANHTFHELLRLKYDRPVNHVTIAWGGLPPDVFRVEAEWTNTTISVETGPPSDTFTHYHDDFNHTAYGAVDASVTGYPMAFYDRSLTKTWGDRSVLFVYDYYAVNSTFERNGDAGITRPDGERVQDHWAVGAWYGATMPGEWTFWHRYKVSTYQWDLPILWGVDHRWAETPWGT